MTGWTADELSRLGATDEVRIASRRRDGSLRGPVIIWAVVVDGTVYVRSAYGADNPWFRRAVASGSGRITGGGAERDVTIAVADPDPALHDSIDEAYRAKYGARHASIVGTVVGPDKIPLTLSLAAA